MIPGDPSIKLLQLAALMALLVFGMRLTAPEPSHVRTVPVLPVMASLPAQMP